MKSTALPLLLALALPGSGFAQAGNPSGAYTITVTLLSSVSSKSRSGSPFSARLEENVNANGRGLLPKGTLLEGEAFTVRPRRLNRPGSVRLVFRRLHLPGGAVFSASASLVSTSEASIKVDPEGTLHPRLSKKRIAIQLGLTALAAKASDDLAEVAISGLTPGKARFFGLGGALGFYLLQKGKDVNVPAGTTLRVAFSRDLQTLLPAMPSPASVVDSGAEEKNRVDR
jgi:hypothetical protein